MSTEPGPAGRGAEDVDPTQAERLLALAASEDPAGSAPLSAIRAGAVRRRARRRAAVLSAGVTLVAVTVVPTLLLVGRGGDTGVDEASTADRTADGPAAPGPSSPDDPTPAADALSGGPTATSGGVDTDEERLFTARSRTPGSEFPEASAQDDEPLGERPVDRMPATGPAQQLVVQVGSLAGVEASWGRSTLTLSDPCVRVVATHLPPLPPWALAASAKGMFARVEVEVDVHERVRAARCASVLRGVADDLRQAEWVRVRETGVLTWLEGDRPVLELARPEG